MIDDLDLRPWTGQDWWHAVLSAACDLQAELQEHARRRFHRERFRCGGCSGYATHVEIDRTRREVERRAERLALGVDEVMS